MKTWMKRNRDAQYGREAADYYGTPDKVIQDALDKALCGACAHTREGHDVFNGPCLHCGCKAFTARTDGAEGR